MFSTSRSKVYEIDVLPGLAEERSIHRDADLKIYTKLI
ncbi:hypothetical protein SAMD00020551_3310 [Mesobacillus selenatarsenatis SF-1]|uniref:Uncharacterized protein n=1 Tax=Mesobacillus selenatarsenatis (strain DSM 18680 / JCM 14380 / FERM P-15431 / SF-1) TaxID=1321606 RepID=A0A0A8X791_MESS1|nr:hypothetical protein SAMD00020551_3310 [Mesobacillus selenatarsenatis SF-1]